MKALDKAMRMLRLPRAIGGGTDGMPALWDDAVDTVPVESNGQTRGPRGEIVQAPGMDLSYRTPMIPARGEATQGQYYDNNGQIVPVTDTTPDWARESAKPIPEGMSLQDGEFYNERSPIGLVGKTLGAAGYDTPGHSRERTTWGEAARNTAAGLLSPGYWADSLERTVKLPEEVREGKVAPNDVMRNLEFVANVGMGGGATAALSGETKGAAGIFGGELAATADHQALAKAKAMAAQGADPAAIWRDTGWGNFFPDGKWRFEINDKNANLNRGLLSYSDPQAGRLGEALDHPDLYAAYPELKDRALISGDMYPLTGGRGISAAFVQQPNEGYFMLDPVVANDPRLAMLHEADHGVQNIEGFSPGASPAHVDSDWLAQVAAKNDPHAARKLNELDSQIDAAYQKYINTPAFTPEWDAAEAELAQLQQLQKVFAPTRADKMEAYQRYAGETSARNVENRADLSAESRRVRPPWETQDYPNDQQFNAPPNPRVTNPVTPEQIIAQDPNKVKAPPKQQPIPTFYANAGNNETMQALGAMARSRELDRMGFYSPSLEASKAIPQQTGTVGQMRQMLLNGGAKPKELAATGFDQAFPDPNAKVSRQQIEDYLRQNRVQLGETRYGAEIPGTSEMDWDEIPDYAREAYDGGLHGEEFDGPSKFESYATPGGIPGSYKENLLTLPTDAAKERARLGNLPDTPENYRAYKNTDDTTYTSSHWPGVENPLLHTRTKDFANPTGKTRLIDESQSDWAQRAREHGVVADKSQMAAMMQRIENNADRMNEIERETNKILGRRAQPFDIQRVIDDPNHPASAQLKAFQDEYLNLANQQNDLESKISAMYNGVPNAPFIGNTSDWTDLGIKHSLINAARDPDVNRIAWTPGDVQNKRYGLEQHVDSIDVLPVSQVGGAGRATVKMKNGNHVRMNFTPDGVVTNSGGHGFEGKQLSEIVGPEIAQKILGQKQVGTLRGMDLAIGGEGQRGYYDKIYPNRTQEVMKKAGLGKPEFEMQPPGGAQVVKDGQLGWQIHYNGQKRGWYRSEADARADLPNIAKESGYPSYAFTPEMRQKILTEGLSLFNKQDPYASAILSAMGREGEGALSEQVGAKAAQGHGPPETGVSGRGELPGGASGLPASGGSENPYARIPGIPESTKIPGHGEVETRPIPWVVDAANDYSKKAGIDHKLPEAFGPLDEERARRIAEAFEAMQHDPTNPEVRRAYEAMADETLAQYKALKDQGARYYFNNGADPYAQSPAMGYPELRDKRSLSIFPTDSGFGSGAEAAQALENNPLLKKTGEKFGDQEATVNDLFRAVHDSFGHFGYGNAFFRAPGEERAWMLHSGMYGPEARKAMTSETRGQNSWLNHGPHAEFNKTASGADTIYAPQKAGLLPDWVTQEGANGISRQQYDAVQKALRMGRNKLFSNSDEQLSLPLAGLAREGAEAEQAPSIGHNQPPAETKPEKPIVPREGLEDGFYSQQVEALKSIPMKAGNAQQWLNALKKAGVKDEELKWTGMGDWLKSKGNEKIPAEDVRAYADENKVIPNTERYTGGDETGRDRDEAWDDAYQRASENMSVVVDPDWVQQYKDEEFGKYTIEPNPEVEGKWRVYDADNDHELFDNLDSEEAANKALKEHIDSIDGDSLASDFGEGSVPWAVIDENGSVLNTFEPRGRNGRGYRDPQQAAEEAISEYASEQAHRDMEDFEEAPRTEGYLSKRPQGGSEYTERVMDTPHEAVQRGGGNGYGDTHIDWPQDNIPGWLLTEDYKDQLTGKPVHHVHEAQSDWAQAGANEGFLGKHTPEEIEAARQARKAAEDEANRLYKERPIDPGRSSGAQEIPEDLKGHYYFDDEAARNSIDEIARNYGYARRDVSNQQRWIDRAQAAIDRYHQEIPKLYEPGESVHSDDVAKLTALQENLKEYQNEMIPYAQKAKEAEDQLRAALAGGRKATPEDVQAKADAYHQADLRYSEASAKAQQMANGISPGPWVNDVPEVTKLLMKRGLLDAANEGKDYFSWSSPDMIRQRWGERDYTEPLYGKMIPNTVLKLAREHDPSAKLESVLLGREGAGKPKGTYSLRDIRDREVPSEQEGLNLPEPSISNRLPAGTVSAASHDVPIRSVDYGPRHTIGGRAPDADHPWSAGRYHLTDENGDSVYSFATREAAENAMQAINDSLAAAKAAPAPEGNAQAVRLTPRMIESIKKRGFSAFLNRDPYVASTLSEAAQADQKDSEEAQPKKKRRLFGGK